MSDEQLREQVADALRLYSHVHKGQACIYLGAALTAVMPIVAKIQAEQGKSGVTKYWVCANHIEDDGPCVNCEPDERYQR